MTSTVKQNADNSRQANQLAAGARDQARRVRCRDQAVSAMTRSTPRPRKIADIIGVIDEIAFQTNLLALTPPWKRHAPASRVAVSRWWRARVRNSHNVRPVAAKEIKA